ncbi:MAG TPA: hypothetical protein VF187_05775, partial [Gemmatimonadales bacterium]
RTPSGWQIDGQAFDSLRRYRVVATDFLVSGGEQNMSWLSERNSQLRILGALRDARLVLIDELRRRFPSR